MVAGAEFRYCLFHATKRRAAFGVHGSPLATYSGLRATRSHIPVLSPLTREESDSDEFHWPTPHRLRCAVCRFPSLDRGVATSWPKRPHPQVPYRWRNRRRVLIDHRIQFATIGRAVFRRGKHVLQRLWICWFSVPSDGWIRRLRSDRGVSNRSGLSHRSAASVNRFG